MAFSRVSENRLREALEEGLFDRLPGAGQPLALDEYFSAPEDLRMAHSVLKNANCVPVEVELRNEIAHLKHTLEQATDEATQRTLQRTLGYRETELAIRLERSRRSRR